MRVIFMGTPRFAVPSLQAILDAGHTVPLVVSTPDATKGRGLKTFASEVKQYALERGLPVATPESLRDPAFAEQVRAAEPDVICVVAFRILPESIYTIPRLGSFNLHGSLLPRYRGAAPINWAIINGDTETGVTTFFLKRSVDTGEVILRRSIAIGPEMTAGELHDSMMLVGADAVVETLRLIGQGNVATEHQDDAAATPAPKIFRADCRINWALPAERVHNFVRGLSPYPGAFTYYAGTMMKLYRARLAGPLGLAPGEIHVEGGARIMVGTGSDALELLEVQQEGKRAMTAAELVRGFRFEQGGRFDDAPTAG